MARSLPNHLRSDPLKYAANPTKYHAGEPGDQASARGQVEPEIEATLLRLASLSPGQRARLERRAENQEAHLRRQEGRDELARIAREVRRTANQAAFAKRRK